MCFPDSCHAAFPVLRRRRKEGVRDSCAGLMEGGWQAPLTTDPEVLYDINMDQTDGSVQEIFMLVDAINDEEGEIVDGNALVAMNTYIDGNGNPAAEIRLAL